MKERMEHLTDDRIHDYLDGELDEEAARAVEAHGAACSRCASRVAALEELLADVGGLPVEATPPRDLWPGIEARIGGGARVIPFPESGDAVPGSPAGDPSAGSAGSGPGRRMSFTFPQLWAAGIAVSLLSGGAVWLAMAAGGTAVADRSGPAVERAVPTARMAAPDAPPPGRVVNASEAYEEAVSELEAVLVAGREFLDPVTLATIEESLATIDRAIEEAEAALARDPGSGLLNRLLLQHQRTRLRILRQATNGLGART